jgi:dTDP-4-dehydrorhamnose reductase
MTPPGPVNAYGRSKLAGETGVRAAGGRAAILRTSWVFSAHGANFVTTMLRLGRAREAVRVVADQVGGPTPAAAIADACLLIARGPARTARRAAPITSRAPQPSPGPPSRARSWTRRACPCRIDPDPHLGLPRARRAPPQLAPGRRVAARGLRHRAPDWHAGLRDVLGELGA